MTHLSFCKSADELKTAIHNGLRASKRNLQAFLDMPGDTAPGEILIEFNHIAAPLNGWAQQASIFQQVHPDTAMQEVGAALEQEVHAFHSQLSLNREVFDRLNQLTLPEDARFQERRFLEHSLRDFRRSGVDKDEAGREHVRKLQEQLMEIGQEFDKNIIMGTTSMQVSGGHKELAGMPQDFLDSHPEDDKGEVRLSTDPTDYMPIMMYCESPAVREAMVRMYNTRAYPENLELLDRLLAKRKELANLLGFDNWADYVTGDKMIGSGQAVADFLGKVMDRSKGLAEEQYNHLLAAKRKLDPSAEKVDSFDSSFLTECIKRDEFSFDSQVLRSYLAYDRVQEGVLKTAADMFGIRFEPRPDLPVWHADVRPFDVIDGDKTIGRFFLDMFPRDGKFKHAAVMDLRDGLSEAHGHTEILPEAALVCNFTKPTETDAGLMLHNQVTTFFHEFGHLMHHMLSGRQSFFGFGGFGVEWDFVEVPSQLFEEWAWDVKILQTFALHETTGEPIPAELVERLRQAEEYGKGLTVVRQMFLATLSLEFHRQDPATLDTTAMVHRLRPEMTCFDELEGTYFQASFGHLNGYSAMYYTYMWSLVISKDMWGAFESDPMDKDVANRYRTKVLQRGGGLDAKDQVSDFLGRDYSFDAWETWLRA
ncbi:MAG: Zn-dependent oligopeptidase [Planctomycetota bacterium]|nr:Zn-dependent oligopeptidase [Planctomycetota bacterium]